MHKFSLGSRVQIGRLASAQYSSRRVQQVGLVSKSNPQGISNQHFGLDGVGAHNPRRGDNCCKIIIFFRQKWQYRLSQYKMYKVHRIVTALNLSFKIQKKSTLAGGEVVLPCCAESVHCGGVR